MLGISRSSCPDSALGTLIPVRRITELEPACAEAWLNLGICLASQGDEAELTPGMSHLTALPLCPTLCMCGCARGRACAGGVVHGARSGGGVLVNEHPLPNPVKHTCTPSTHGTVRVASCLVSGAARAAPVALVSINHLMCFTRAISGVWRKLTRHKIMGSILVDEDLVLSKSKQIVQS